jgi:hypothetical protein
MSDIPQPSHAQTHPISPGAPLPLSTVQSTAAPESQSKSGGSSSGFGFMARVQSPVIKSNLQARLINASTLNAIPPPTSSQQEVQPSAEDLQVRD